MIQGESWELSSLLCARVCVLLRKQYTHLGVFPSTVLKTCSARKDGGLPAVKWGLQFLLQARWMETLGTLLPGRDMFIDANEETQDSAVNHSVVTQAVAAVGELEEAVAQTMKTSFAARIPEERARAAAALGCDTF